MPSILEHHSINSTKMLVVGESGTGKSGMLASLVTAGFKLRILDFDNGIDVLKSYLTNPSSIYYKQIKDQGIDLNDAVRFKTITEEMKELRGRVIPSKGDVFRRAMETLQEWKEDDGTNLGKPRDWDRQTIVVLDSLTMLSKAALYAIQGLNGRLGEDKVGNESRRDIGQAQAQIERVLELLYDEHFKPNVLVNSHIVWRNPEGTDPEDKLLGKKAYPSSLGVALAPRIPRFFNTVLHTMTVGSGQSTKRQIMTTPQGSLDLKSSAPLALKPSYPIDTGLGEIFKALRS